MAVADAEQQADELLVDRVAGLLRKRLGQAQVDAERIGGTDCTGLFGEAEGAARTDTIPGAKTA